MIIRRCVPEGEQSKILQECHASPYGGHFARDKTADKIFPVRILLAYDF